MKYTFGDIVVVDENEAGTKADELRSAGFECYPLF